MSNTMNVGSVRLFDTLCRDKAQALKPLEEAAEAFGAWQQRDAYRGCAAGPCRDELRRDLIDECLDAVQATVNLLAAVGARSRRPSRAWTRATPRGGGCDPRRAHPSRQRGHEDDEEAGPASRRQRPAPARGAPRGKARQHRPVLAVQLQRELPPQGHAQGVPIPGVGRRDRAGQVGPGAREKGRPMTEERECLMCSRSMLSLVRRDDERCEAYNVLLLCGREPMRARRVETHGTCERWKGFDDDGGKDDGE